MRDTALSEVKGQGGADRGPAAVPDDPVTQSQAGADQRRLRHPGLPKVGQTTVERIPLSGIGLDYPGAQLDRRGR